MTLPEIVWVDSPASLPHRLPAGRFAVVDVAFASQEKFAQTQRFMEENGASLAAWVDHHKHDAWPQYALDARFVLVPNVLAHACPELVTPDVVRRVGPVAMVLAHSDFDGMMSAVNWLREGVPPYPEANEDARAADSPGRGHVFCARGWRLAEALEELKDRLHTPQRHAVLTEIALSLVNGAESTELTQKVDELARKAVKVTQQAQAVVQRGKEESPGLFVVRFPSNLSARLKKQVLLLAEEKASIAVVVEGTAAGSIHVTAATFDERLDLSRCTGLPVGRSDFRFVSKLQDGEPVLAQLAELAATGTAKVAEP
jgi:hypothetical protein